MTYLADTWIGDHILSIVIFLPILAAALLFSRTEWSPRRVRRFALGAALVTLAFALLALVRYVDEGIGLTDTKGDWRLSERVAWLVDTGGAGGESAAALAIQYYVGLDGIGLPLLLLTALLTPLAIWGSFSGIQDRCREFYALMLLLHGAMLGVFCARDLLLFYVFFEFTLIPLYFLIGIWGGAQRQKAADMFFIYTLTGSMLTFAAVLYLGWLASTVPLGPNGTLIFSFELDRLYELSARGLLPAGVQWWLFVAFFAGFAIKVPLFPLHTWLPLAHTEAPTAGSVILAAVLLKLGTYGFLRLSLPMLPDASIELAPVVGWLAVAGIVYGALAAWVQRDMKKLVAYSSVSHLGFCLLGMFSLKMAGLTGSLLYMVNHGLSTGALFLIVGMVYERYHTREFDRIGGLARRMPWMAFFLIFFVFASVGLPGLNGFVSEFLVLLGTFTSAQPLLPGTPGPLGVPFAVVAASGILLGAIYMLHMAARVLFGPVKTPGHDFDASTGLTQDLTRREIGILAPIAAACLFLGVYPKPLIDAMEPSLDRAVLARVAPAHSAIVSGTGASPVPSIASSDAPSTKAQGKLALGICCGAFDLPGVRSAPPDVHVHDVRIAQISAGSAMEGLR